MVRSVAYIFHALYIDPLLVVSDVNSVNKAKNGTGHIKIDKAFNLVDERIFCDAIKKSVRWQCIIRRSPNLTFFAQDTQKSYYPAWDAHVKIDVDLNADLKTTYGFAVDATLVPPKIHDVALYASVFSIVPPQYLFLSFNSIALSMVISMPPSIFVRAQWSNGTNEYPL